MTYKDRYEQAKWNYYVSIHQSAYNNDPELFERGFKESCKFPIISKPTHLETAIKDFLTFEGHQASKITTSVLAVAVQPFPSVTVTVYVPSSLSFTFDNNGFCSVEVKPLPLLHS